jgi:hypothetical protein
MARMSSTCKSVTEEGSGFRGTNGTEGKPSIRVHDFTNSGKTCEDPRPSDGVRAKRGNKEGRGEAGASGYLAA